MNNIRAGQLFLPPKRQCSIKFLHEILTGKKKYFRNDEMPVVYVQRLEKLTIKNVLEKVYSNEAVRQYLPDFDVDP